MTSNRLRVCIYDSQPTKPTPAVTLMNIILLTITIMFVTIIMMLVTMINNDSDTDSDTTDNRALCASG